MPFTVIKGPAIITRAGVSIYTVEDISVTGKSEDVDVPSDAYGKVNSIRKSVSYEIKFKPFGFIAAAAAIYWPYATTMPGTLMCGDTDVPLVIHTMAGQKYTFARAGLSAMPGLNPSLSNPLIGDVTFTAFPASDKELEDTDSIVKTETIAFADTSFDPSQALRGPWTVTYNGVEIETEAGVQVTFAQSLTTETTEQRGAYDASMAGIGATATLTPVGVGHADWLSMQGFQGAGNGIGTSATSRGKALVISTTGFVLTLPNVTPTQAESHFGTSKKLPGQLQLAANRTMTLGALAPLWTIGTGA
jgi:hypothetical protein